MPLPYVSIHSLLASPSVFITAMLEHSEPLSASDLRGCCIALRLLRPPLPFLAMSLQSVSGVDRYQDTRSANDGLVSVSVILALCLYMHGLTICWPTWQGLEQIHMPASPDWRFGNITWSR